MTDLAVRLSAAIKHRRALAEIAAQDYNGCCRLHPIDTVRHCGVDQLIVDLYAAASVRDPSWPVGGIVHAAGMGRLAGLQLVAEALADSYGVLR